MSNAQSRTSARSGWPRWAVLLLGLLTFGGLGLATGMPAQAAPVAAASTSVVSAATSAPAAAADDGQVLASSASASWGHATAGYNGSALFYSGTVKDDASGNPCPAIFVKKTSSGSYTQSGLHGHYQSCGPTESWNYQSSGTELYGIRMYNGVGGNFATLCSSQSACRS